MQNDSVGNTAANNASMCENSIKIHDNMKQISYTCELVFIMSKFLASGSSARVSKRAFNRWMVAYTLLKNEQLIVCIDICILSIN